MPFARLQAAAARVRTFLAPVPGAIREHLNTSEIARIAVTTLASGGSAASVVAALAGSVGTIVAPQDAAAAAAVLTLVAEVVRRLGHGDAVLPGSGAAPALRLYPPRTA